MYIVGHCVISELSGVFSTQDIYGDGLYALLFPDYTRCHDWGYDQCFNINQNSCGLIPRLLKAHMLEDWYVHYGDSSENRVRRGWAYKKMAVFTKKYHDFFNKATSKGLRKDTQESHSFRGFGHTLIEYSIDIHLVRSGHFSPWFEIVKKQLSKLGSGTGVGSHLWVNKVLNEERVSSHSNDLISDVESFGKRVAASENPTEFALRAGIKKFGLRECDESLKFIGEFIDSGMNEISSKEYDFIVNATADFVAKWMDILPTST